MGTEKLVASVSNNDMHICQFADFRGLVWPSTTDVPAQIEGQIRETGVEDPDYTLLRRNWPLIKASAYEVTDSDKYFSANDVVACSVGVASGQADKNVGIYASTLGQQIRLQPSPVQKTAPIRYLVLAKTKNYRQIGRLIDKIDALGVYRLTALRDFQKVREAGKELQKIEEVIDRAHPDVAVQPEFVSRVSEMLDDVGDGVEGGLAYRLSTSIHYAQNLKHLIASMRFQKIVGFESYDEFVERKLFRIYDYTEVVGRRMERMNRRRAALLTQLQIKSIEDRADEGNNLNRIGHTIEIFALTYYIGWMVSYLQKPLTGQPMLEVIFPSVFLAWLLFRSHIKSGLTKGLKKKWSRSVIGALLAAVASSPLWLEPLTDLVKPH